MENIFDQHEVRKVPIFKNFFVFFSTFLLRLWMGVGVKLSGVPSSIANFSIISNPSQNFRIDGDNLLGIGLFFFCADVVLLPPLLFILLVVSLRLSL